MPYKNLIEIENLLINIAQKKGLKDVHVTWKTNFFEANNATAILSHDNNKKIHFQFSRREMEDIQTGNIDSKIMGRIINSINVSLDTGSKGPEAKPRRTP